MSMTNPKNEILSPAGSMDTLYAGINAGADAVYIGGQKFGARAYADNPESTDLLRAIDYVHLQEKKIYLTVNTLLKSSEIESQLYDYLLPLYEQGLDAVIVQDLGVFEFIRKNFKDLDIHASTQMAVMGVESAKLLKEMGASRIVTARELSLTELKTIHDTVDIEIESFIHGAMCYSYSGMCLFSSIIGGRSGNRGRCAGPCRQPYEVFHGKNRLNDNNSLYALSLKDMNTLEILPEIINSGIYSLKIEGRMKSPEYAAGVVSIYRKYLDLFYEKGMENYKPDKKDMENLAGLYSRSGKSTGYYKCHNSKSMVSFSKPAYRTENETFIEEIRSKYCENRLKKDVSAEICLKPNEPMLLTLTDENIHVTAKGNIAQLPLKRPIERGSILKQLNKTGDSFINFTKINIEIEDKVFVPVSQLNELRREAVRQYEEKLLSPFKRKICSLLEEAFINKEEADSETVKSLEILKISESIESAQSTQNAQIQKGKSLSCQINTLEQLSSVLTYKEIGDVYISMDFLSARECIEAVKSAVQSDKNCYINLPFIYREAGQTYVNSFLEQLETEDLLNKIIFSVRNIDELGFVKRKGYCNFVIDNSLYAFNRYAMNFFYESGASRITLPYELNYRELKNLTSEEAEKNEMVIYGKIPLMITAGCLMKNFYQCKQQNNRKEMQQKVSDFDERQKSRNFGITLKDRLGAEFNAVNCCNFCYNIIYNNLPVSLLGVSDKLKKLNTKHLRINFTTEDFDKTNEILEKYVKVFYYNEYSDELKSFTRGHFNRGVE